ncbi:hypothetical protein [Marinitoga arctica]
MQGFSNTDIKDESKISGVDIISNLQADKTSLLDNFYRFSL